METIRRRELDYKLNEKFPYVPPMERMGEEAHFDETEGWVPDRRVQFEEDVANNLEALKVKVWRDGGPEILNNKVDSPNGERVAVVELCEVGECPQYIPRQLHPCYKCGKQSCQKHRKSLLGKWVCPGCEMQLRNV